MTNPETHTLLVVSDFDNTAAECNVAQLLISIFAGTEAAAVEQAYHRGDLTFRDYQEKMYGTIVAPVADLMAYAGENVSLRPGLQDAVAATREPTISTSCEFDASTTRAA